MNLIYCFIFWVFPWRLNVSCSFLHIEVKYSWFQTFAVFWIYYVFFWVFPRRLNYICRRFGTLYQFHLQGLDVKYEVYFILYIQPLKMEQIECSETSANYNTTPGKYPKEYRQKCHNFQDEDIKNVLLPSECGEDLWHALDPSWIQIGISHCQNTTTDLTDRFFSWFHVNAYFLHYSFV